MRSAAEYVPQVEPQVTTTTTSDFLDVASSISEKPVDSEQKQKKQKEKQQKKPQKHQKATPQQQAEQKNFVEKLQEQLEALQRKEGGQELQFPTTLNGYERMLVHDMAEKMKLEHVSVGQGSER